MAVDQNQVNALLEEMQSEKQILANAVKRRDDALKANDLKTYHSEHLFIHNLQDKYRSKPEKVYQQVIDEIALDKSLKKH